MKKSGIVAILGLAITYALPSCAQQSDVADFQTTKSFFKSFEAYDRTFNNNDAAAIAAYYTRNAILVTPEGPIQGREAIQKWYADLFQRVRPKNGVTSKDSMILHAIGTAGNEVWTTGQFSVTEQGKNGEPILIKRHWLEIYVREGDDWKIRASAYNIAP
jgi:ketosteroid isomerase-like protein